MVGGRRLKTSNKIKRTPGEIVFDIINITIMLLISFVMLYPMLHVLFASFSDSAELMIHTGLLLKPAGFSLEAYNYVLNYDAIPKGYSVTLFVVIVGTALNIILTAFAAFFISRTDQFLAKYVSMMIIFTMFFGGGMIPEYLNVKQLGLYDSIWALIIPVALSAFNIVILRTSFQALPASLEESAKLDGAGPFTLLFRIFIPLSKAVLAVLVLYYGVAHWNSWFSAMLYIQDRRLYPLQLILREILISNDTSSMLSTSGDVTMIAEAIKYALIVVTTLPILCLYPFLQKYFTKGVLIGAVKG